MAPPEADYRLTSSSFVMNINVRGSVDLVRQFVPYLSTIKPLEPDGERGIIICKLYKHMYAVSCGKFYSVLVYHYRRFFITDGLTPDDVQPTRFRNSH